MCGHLPYSLNPLVQEAGMEGAENHYVEQCRPVSCNMYQDCRPQSCRDPPIANDHLEKKTGKRMGKNKDMWPKGCWLKIQSHQSFSCQCRCPETLKHKKAKGLKLHFNQLMIPQVLGLRVVGGWGNAATILTIAILFSHPAGRKEHEIPAMATEGKVRPEDLACLLYVHRPDH
jgi:hypothetical protein